MIEEDQVPSLLRCRNLQDRTSHSKHTVWKMLLSICFTFLLSPSPTCCLQTFGRWMSISNISIQLYPWYLCATESLRSTPGVRAKNSAVPEAAGHEEAGPSVAEVNSTSFGPLVQ